MAVTGRPGFKIVAPALLRVMPLNVYVYYQVARAGASKSEVRIHEMQSALCDRTGVAGRLLKKKDQPLLWMEVYENVTGEDFEDALTQLSRNMAHGNFLNRARSGISSVLLCDCRFTVRLCA